MLSTSQANWSSTFYLHDAVYLYLRVINQTLAEGNMNFSDGRLIRSRAVGQEFAGKQLLYYVSYLCCRTSEPRYNVRCFVNVCSKLAGSQCSAPRESFFSTTLASWTLADYSKRCTVLNYESLSQTLLSQCTTDICTALIHASTLHSSIFGG